ncbi:MAG: pyridoxal phosphate-dependent aminotransferase [Clostridia bacterium]|nr:pyridoxal phosphate-dependent aminotransferase [Clostridia bacterium]
MFSKTVVENMAGGSWIRAMFELGNQLKAQYGDDKVYDFTLGNPDPEPPEAVLSQMEQLVRTPNIHKYMSNAGFPDVRAKVAAYMKRESGVDFTENQIIMVTGAAAGLSITLKSLMNPGEEVIVLAPYFMEYNSYVGNQNGKVVPVKTLPDTFQPDVPAIAKAITANTKAIILNSPNNPSGAIYTEESLQALAKVLEDAEKEFGHPVYVISDEPYVKIVYDGVKVPSVAAIFKNAITVNSFSKSLALPGERIGYIAVNPTIEDVDTLVAAMVYCNRTLGFVNAPGLFQKVIADHLDEAAGLEAYKERRDMLYDILVEAGFSCAKPQGAFYMFAKCPISDDAAFSQMAIKHNIILVGGSGFGYPGYFRLAYCVSYDTIRNSAQAFKDLYKEATGK